MLRMPAFDLVSARHAKVSSLFQLTCEQDLEGIVAKQAESLYRSELGKPPWIKIKNPDYSQAEDRHDLFRSRRGLRP